MGPPSVCGGWRNTGEYAPCVMTFDGFCPSARVLGSFVSMRRPAVQIFRSCAPDPLALTGLGCRILSLCSNRLFKESPATSWPLQQKKKKKKKKKISFPFLPLL